MLTGDSGLTDGFLQQQHELLEEFNFALGMHICLTEDLREGQNTLIAGQNEIIHFHEKLVQQNKHWVLGLSAKALWKHEDKDENGEEEEEEKKEDLEAKFKKVHTPQDEDDDSDEGNGGMAVCGSNC